MSDQKHTVLLSSEQHFDGRLPTRHVGYLLAELPVAVRGAVSMALRNRSKGAGKPPKWLERASDVRFVRHSGNGESVLEFELPTLGEATGDLLAQGELFESTRPAKELTGIDLLIRTLLDIEQGQTESDTFDPQLLYELVKFRRVLKNGPFCSFSLMGSTGRDSHAATFNAALAQQCETIYNRTPKPQRVRIAGNLDGLEASTQRFSLLLDSGEKVVGVFPEDQTDRMQGLWRGRVLVLGTAVFRASGTLLRVEAESIAEGDQVAPLFSKLPVPSRARLDATRLRKPQSGKSGMAAIMGKWPGDESEEEIAEALAQLS